MLSFCTLQSSNASFVYSIDSLYSSVGSVESIEYSPLLFFNLLPYPFLSLSSLRMTKNANAGFGGDNEKVLQAVVMADSFNERFMPITLDRPRCLLPLVNVPIIEYTFEFLAVSGVQEVLLFCRSHADQIKQYIK